MNEDTYKKMYHTGAGIPKSYGLPKIHKEGVPLRPIISCRGAVSYETAKELARILKPLVGKSTYNVQNTRDFDTADEEHPTSTGRVHHMHICS